MCGGIVFLFLSIKFILFEKEEKTAWICALNMNLEKKKETKNDEDWSEEKKITM